MNERIVTLLYKSISDVALDAAEKAELDDWIAKSPHNRYVFEEARNEEKLSEEVRELLRDNFDLSYRIILHFFNSGVRSD